MSYLSQLLNLPLELRRLIWGYAIGYGIHIHGELQERMPIIPHDIKSMKLSVYPCHAAQSDFSHYAHSKIYDDSIIDESGLERYHIPTGRGLNHTPCTPFPPSDKPSLAWLHTNRTIYHEATAVLFTETVLCFHDHASFQCFLWTLPPAELSLIRTIHVQWQGPLNLNNNRTWDFGGKASVPALSGLRTLHISIDTGLTQPARAGDEEYMRYLRANIWGQTHSFWKNSLELLKEYRPRRVTVVVDCVQADQRTMNAEAETTGRYGLSVMEKRFLAESLRLFLLDSGSEVVVDKGMAEEMRRAVEKGRSLLRVLDPQFS